MSMSLQATGEEFDGGLLDQSWITAALSGSNLPRAVRKLADGVADYAGILQANGIERAGWILDFGDEAASALDRMGLPPPVSTALHS